MATTEERMKILNMIREGKISAEEGAKLLSALGDTEKPSRMPSTRTCQLWVIPKNPPGCHQPGPQVNHAGFAYGLPTW